MARGGGPEGVTAQAYPVSGKGVAAREGRNLPLDSERGERALPGGRPGAGQTPRQCAVRQIAGQTGWAVTAGPVPGARLRHIGQAARHVLPVTRGCQLNPGRAAPARDRPG